MNADTLDNKCVNAGAYTQESGAVACSNIPVPSNRKSMARTYFKTVDVMTNAEYGAFSSHNGRYARYRMQLRSKHNVSLSEGKTQGRISNRPGPSEIFCGNNALDNV